MCIVAIHDINRYKMAFRNINLVIVISDVFPYLLSTKCEPKTTMVKITTNITKKYQLFLRLGTVL